MEFDYDGKPTRSKMSKLFVASTKARGLLGKADLDLSQFGTTDYLKHKLPLNDCNYEGAFIEVHLKGSI